MRKFIALDRSVIVACDVASLEDLDELVKNTSKIEGIGGYKVGLELIIREGLPSVVERIRQHSEKPVIYDHQKGATDIPALGQKFARACKDSEVDAVILFPFGGAETEVAWIKACQDEGLTVLVGAHMTQKKFLASEGGFIADEAPEEIFRVAAENGVRDFVVPGNKPEFVAKYRQLLTELLGEDNFSLYAPGFIAQGGEISETGKVAGRRWHAIVGSAIYKAEDKTYAAREVTSQIGGSSS